jgi:hypothetical protein
MRLFRHDRDLSSQAGGCAADLTIGGEFFAQMAVESSVEPMAAPAFRMSVGAA